MATYTKNINLLKPAEQEKYDVNLRNNNWDKIDKAIGDTSDAIKKHKEANPIDHPDGSVTTPKLRDKNVTTEKLADKSVTAAKLADDINMKLDNSYVKKSGDTMTGPLAIDKNTYIRINRKNGAGYHTISDGGLDSDGGGTNLDLGSYTATREANLCCRNRPGWFGKDGQAVFKPFMTLQDISITYGNIRDGGTLPIPDGFEESECNWLLSIDQSNIDKWYIDFRESNSSNMINLECWREGRKVHVGTRLKGQDGVSKTYNDSTKNNGAEVFLPGTANYICIAVKRGQIMEQIKRKDETLYIGSDWSRVYEIKGMDLTEATAVCKFRDTSDNLLIEAECTVQDNRIYLTVNSALSLKIPRGVKQGKYDIFLIGNTYTYKIMMGSITFVPDVSMH